MNILLHTEVLNERGTTVAIRDYAQVLSRLGLQVSIAYSSIDTSNVDSVVDQIRSEFELYDYSDFQIFARQNSKKWDAAYFIKYGYFDGKIVPKIPNIVHAVFQSYDPHGEIYLYVSEWLSRKMRIENLKNLAKLSPKGFDSFRPQKFRHLSHIVALPFSERKMRSDWGIPADGIIGGRHGAADTFDVRFVQDLIGSLLTENKKLYFVFANTNRFIEHPRVIFLPTLSSRRQTREYLASLDFYLHARHRGETFGLALLEAMLCKIPVFSYSKGVDGNHRYLLRMSQDSLFESPEQLRQQISKFREYRDVEYNFSIANRFSQDSIMHDWQSLLNELGKSPTV
jgi:glycosyltransferase involved in cell wall biosynthesis